jgi:hypothetical protein
MRRVKNKQLPLGATPISQIKFDLGSRDDIPQLLMGLQHIYVTSEIREKVFTILKTMVHPKINIKTGCPGMDLWNIFVLGTLRLDLNWDYDRLQEMANNHKLIREMLGHGILDKDYVYRLQTLKDNVPLLTKEISDKISEVVVKSGHKLCKAKDTKLRGRCDSFVLETNVHYPTDINLLFDAMRKVIMLIARLCEDYGVSGWRQKNYNIKKIKNVFRKAQMTKRSTSKDSEKKKKQNKIIIHAHQVYLDIVDSFLQKTDTTLENLRNHGTPQNKLTEVEGFIIHAKRQIDHVKRRVIDEKKIPHGEKIFSIFQEHTEWICKGKAGVPVELGVRVCIMEDQYGFVLHHKVMQKQTDDQVAVSMIKETQTRFPSLRTCSFDKGFHSPTNQEELRELLDLSVLPKKGRLSQRDKEIEYSEEFVKIRRQHSAVESGINALEVHGLDRCPDHEIDGFERYVALAVLGRNIQKLGSLIKKSELRSQVCRKKRRKAA